MREFDVTCPQCDHRYKVNEQMMETLQETGCVMCKAPMNERTTPA